MSKSKQNIFNEYALKVALASQRLEGFNVTDEMIVRLEQALTDNSDIDKSKLVALLLKEDRRSVKISSDLKDEGQNFIKLEASRKRRTTKPKR